MLNGSSQTTEAEGAWEGLRNILSRLADAETETEVLGQAGRLLHLSGYGGGLYLEAGSVPWASTGQYRGWLLSPGPQGHTVPVPLALPAAAFPYEIHTASQPSTLSEQQIGTLSVYLSALPPTSNEENSGQGGLALPLRTRGRHLGTLLAFGTGSSGSPLLQDALHPLATHVSTSLDRVRLAARVAHLGGQVQALAQANVGLFITNEAGRITWYNTRFQEITELSPEMQNDLWAYLVPGYEQQRFSAWWQGSLLGQKVPHHQFALLSPDGGTRWVEASSTPLIGKSGEVSGQVGTLEDITERRVAQERLTFQAQHDPLTQLPNRAFLALVWPQLAQSARQNGKSLGLLFIDLERFKQVNDSLGHQVGDQLLTLVARRLQQAVGNDGVVVRHGGDEFVVVLRTVSDTADAEAQAQTLLTGLQAPLRIGQHLLRVSCRIGLSLFPQNAEDLPTLLQHADAAMYRLKHARHGGVLAYSSGMSGGGLEQLDLENEFRTALKTGELRLHYQPKVSLREGRQIGFEALVRWQHPRHGLMYPASFLPMATEAGLLSALSEWVIGEAHRQLIAWTGERKRLLPVAVNVDARQLVPGQLPALIESLARRHPFPLNLLELEITEEGLPADVMAIDSDLKQLKAAGLSIAIDDFGRGFSNLSQLQRLHVDRLKIDRSYVARLEHSESDRAITQAAISVGHALGARVLAEGIETPGQLAILMNLGCDEGQGYLWAKPCSAEDLIWE